MYNAITIHATSFCIDYMMKAYQQSFDAQQIHDQFHEFFTYFQIKASAFPDTDSDYSSVALNLAGVITDIVIQSKTDGIPSAYAVIETISNALTDIED